MNSEFVFSRGSCGDVTILVDDDWCPFFPARAVAGNPSSSCPFADVISARENSRSLNVSNLDNVFVFGKNVTQLLACSAVTHRTIDVFQNLRSVAGSFS